jgi:hypothetical protein
MHHQDLLSSSRPAPKRVLLSMCLLLVLAAGVATQIAAQSSISLDLTMINEGTLFDVFVNGVGYCLVVDSGSAPSVPSSELKAAGTGASVDIIATLTGEAFEGACSLTDVTSGARNGGFGVSDYRGTDGGNLIGPFTMTVTLDLPGGLPGDFTIIIVFTLGVGGEFHAESKITGAFTDSGSTGCMLENMVSEYVSVTGVGLSLTLQLLTHQGACSTESNGFSAFILPTLLFGSAAPVGGFVESVNKLLIVAPYVTLFALVAVVAVVTVKPRKKPES